MPDSANLVIKVQKGKIEPSDTTASYHHLELFIFFPGTYTEQKHRSGIIYFQCNILQIFRIPGISARFNIIAYGKCPHRTITGHYIQFESIVHLSRDIHFSLKPSVCPPVFSLCPELPWNKTSVNVIAAYSAPDHQ